MVKGLGYRVWSLGLRVSKVGKRQVGIFNPSCLHPRLFNSVAISIFLVGVLESVEVWGLR